MRYLRSAMRRSKKQKPPSLYLATSSRETSPCWSSVLSDWDADDEGFMSSAEFLPSRPLSVAIPSGPYCPRRPTLQEVLADSAPPPWSLSAFMAYLSQNHCLETLEFTMDASRYRKYYDSMADSHPGTPISPASEGCEYVKMLWQKLLDAYIAPNGPREVNLPSDVRDRLMKLPNTLVPPHPSELDPAVKIIFELMDESVLVPFLNSVTSLRGPETIATPWTSTDEVPQTAVLSHGSYDERSLSPAQSRNRRDRSPPGSGSSMDIVALSTGPAPRPAHQSHLTAALNRSAGGRISAYFSSTSSSSEIHEAGLTDDSASSPSNSDLGPMTPPTTPPTSDTGFQGVSPGTSPKNSRTEGTSWKKMGQKFGWKKSKSGHGSNGSTSSKRYPVGRDVTADDDSA
jgi:hypothetical protein